MIECRNSLVTLGCLSTFSADDIVTVQKSKLAGKGGQAATAAQPRRGKPGLKEAPKEKIRPEVDKPVGHAVPFRAAGPSDVPRFAATTSVTGEVIDSESLLFDPVWYTRNYPDVVAAGLDPVRHFFENGAREGRDPNSRFKTAWYLTANADVAASKMNPFLHYLFYGAREGRKPQP